MSTVPTDHPARDVSVKDFAARTDGVSAPGGLAVGRPVLADVRDATASIGGRTIWSHVNATVSTGEFVAILGPNGVGKSTLLKAILGLQPLSAGSVSLLGGRPGDSNRYVGYLPQRRSFDASVRVRGVDIIRLGFDGDRWGIPIPGRRSRATSARVAELVSLVGAGDYADRPIGQLSGGEQQRLLIAQALARRPRLLMLDEPLDSLDLPTQHAVAALISRISWEEDVAIVVVAHDVNPILAYLDRVIYLGHGGAIAGTPQQVITTEILSSLYHTPIEVVSTSDGRLAVVGQPEAPAIHTDRHLRR
jgi:zinc/manganese transport system ATP-binding protein